SVFAAAVFNQLRLQLLPLCGWSLPEFPFHRVTLPMSLKRTKSDLFGIQRCVEFASEPHGLPP
ncbi:hypothetical protein, partial [Pseudomonas veronii]|uniref:hypothetical protein n=1 Tax=Pseudomonas veronii TaxID=76761 RepID=UPI001E5F679A